MSSNYLLAGQTSELERLQLQSRVWEPAGRVLLDRLGGGAGLRALDVGCGCLGWLRLLSTWVGPSGSVTGTDVDDTLLESAQALVTEEALGDVVLAHDDLFRSELSPGAFDLVHARFEVAPLGRADEQLAVYQRLAAPGGWIVLEDPDSSSWHFNPPAPAAERLIALCLAAFLAAGADFDAGGGRPNSCAVWGSSPRCAPRSSRCRRGTPTCGCRCSSASRWSRGCSG